MMNKPYAVIFTGELVPGADIATVRSNLVLAMGLNEAKVSELFGRGEVMLKHTATAAEAERLADKFYQAGAICTIRDHRPAKENPGVEVGGESSLVRLLRRFSGSDSSRKRA